jgi:hypothetical protein
MWSKTSIWDEVSSSMYQSVWYSCKVKQSAYVHIPRLVSSKAGHYYVFMFQLNYSLHLGLRQYPFSITFTFQMHSNIDRSDKVFSIYLYKYARISP